MQKIISQNDSNTLSDCLHYLFVSEVKEICRMLLLPEKGKKAENIQRIITFLKEGRVLTTPTFPKESCAKKGVSYPLSPKTLILYGSYKNDAAARAFFKRLIGSHFYFTVYGLDWINERWYAANPPSYMEFAQFWQNEYLERKNQKSPLKKEWAYLNFIRRYLESSPNSSRNEIAEKWDEERSKMKATAYEILKQFLV